MNADHQVVTESPTPNPDYPLDPGWEFLRWVSQQAATIDRRAHTRFCGDADVHRAYDRGGIPAAIERCIAGMSAAMHLHDQDRFATDYSGAHLMFWWGWFDMAQALMILRNR